ncbi:hypothetical protein ABBQ38_004758 [Trebouxia sp. C0009 RCD-2024]
MPGLLQAPDSKFGSWKFAYALAAEFIGVMLFAFAGSATPAGTVSTQVSTRTAAGNSFSSNWAPWGNGMSLAVLVFITANISGGHLNPAVTLATIVTGHIGLIKGCAYMLCQICGACFGMLMVAGLVPGTYVGMGNLGTGCFAKGDGITLGMLFGWETVMTFVLVSVVYAVAIGEPSFGVMGPFAVGLALFAMVFAGSQFTGTAINPARALGPAIVFHCRWDQVWLYVIAECVGGVIAGMLAGPLYGVGSPFLKKMLPWIHETEIVKEDGKVEDTAHADHKDGNSHQHRNEIYDTSGTDAPLYPAHAPHGHDGLTTIV